MWTVRPGAALTYFVAPSVVVRSEGETQVGVLRGTSKRAKFVRVLEGRLAGGKPFSPYLVYSHSHFHVLSPSSPKFGIVL
jgi:hypothetical protein